MMKRVAIGSVVAKARRNNDEAEIVIYCNKGVTGNAAQNILINAGFKKVYNLSGGHKFYNSTKKNNR